MSRLSKRLLGRCARSPVIFLHSKFILSTKPVVTWLPHNRRRTLKRRLIAELMSYPNAAWDAIIQQAHANPSILQDSDTIKVIGNVMKTNVSACSSIGSYFYPQIGRIYLDMLSMYRATSGMISEAVARDGKFISIRCQTIRHWQSSGDIATKMPKVRGLRTIKKEILKLIETYVEKADDLEMVRTNIVPALLEAVLVDYNRNVPNARDAEVLKVMSVIITKLSVRWTPHRSKYSVVHSPIPF